jgi:hypothetical protein
MAPAIVDTIQAHFRDFRIEPGYYDLIVTGDLSKVGYEIAAGVALLQAYLKSLVRAFPQLLSFHFWQLCSLSPRDKSVCMVYSMC